MQTEVHSSMDSMSSSPSISSNKDGAMRNEEDRQSEDIVLSPKDLLHASDPNVALTNPVILSHLQQLHDRARRKRQPIQDDDEEENKRRLQTKINAFNKRSQVGAFRLKIAEPTEKYMYNGPVKFYYQASGAKHESFRLMTLTDQDRVKNILPKLRQKFAIPEEQRCTIREMINGDEILLDPDDRPLELTVNSKSPLAFHLVTGSDRNSELLKNLRQETFTPEQRRKLIEKFNLKTDGDNDMINSSGRSSPSTSMERASLSGSSVGGSVSCYSEIKHQPGTPTSVISMSKLNGYADVARNTSFDKADLTPLKASSNGGKILRSNTMPVNDERPASLLPPSGGQTPSTRSGRIRNLKNKKDANSKTQRRDSRSSSARKIFFSLRKYRGRSSSRDRNASKSLSEVQSDAEHAASSTSAELSSNVNLPGILKIFGNAVSPGANYKSVMATNTSNAKELVKIALERYGIEKQQAKYHVLCEVVGRVKEEDSKNNATKALKIKAKKNKRKSVEIPSMKLLDGNDFTEDYVRPLSDHEKPLILQSYWKPLDGHCRRFEIRRRSKVFTKVEKDHSTRDINMQARRLVMQKSRNNLNIPFLSNQPQTDSEEDDEKITSFDIRRPSPEPRKKKKSLIVKDVEKDHIDVLADLKSCVDAEAECAAAITDRVTPDGGSSTSPPDSESKSDSKPPDSPPCPYLITLQGNEDNLIHSLDNQEVLIGSDVTDFKLSAPDILPHHCVLKRRLEILFSESDSYEALKRWCVTITPLSSSAEVRINGSKMTNKHTLQHGELVSVGQHHMFMFKDPSSHVNLSNVVTFSLTNSSNHELDTSSIEAHGSDRCLNSNDKQQPDSPTFLKVIKTDFCYPHAHEDEILNEIFNSASDLEDVPTNCALAPATLLCQCIAHSCLNFDLQHKNDLLLKIASNLQTLVLNATRNVSVQEIQTSTDTEDTAQLLTPMLHPVVYWMSNALEIFEFLQKDLVPIIQKRIEEEKAKGLVDPDVLASAESYVVNEEILALLEEVVMYAFQQIVYYLTKTLYGSLPAILECNPFAKEASTRLSVSDITNVYSSAHEMTQLYDVNERISDQLFAYLFFFTNISLFNTLMEEDSSTKYYRWEMGVRIRGNLEHVESWAAECGYEDQCFTYLEKISALANLLATPRGQFIKSSWSSFCENFPALAPTQLHKVLTGYQLPANQTVPKSWSPDVKIMNEALDEDMIMESYDNHPPLMLPVAGSKINFRLLPTEPWFQDLHNRVKTIAATSLGDGEMISHQTNAIVREQPEGRELNTTDNVTSQKRDVTPTFSDVSSTKKSKQISGKVDEQSQNNFASLVEKKKNDEKETNLITASTNGGGRIVSSSSCSSSSEPEAYVIRQHKSPHQHRKVNNVITKASDAINNLVLSDDIGEDCDEVVVLPVTETTSLASHLSSNKSPSISRTPSTGSTNLSISSHNSAQGMPKEVFIVDIKKGKKGLGVGLVDGVITSLGVQGVYVRSLIPNGPPSKHTHTKHHDIMRCWLQEGRLQLGDRILAANGVSLINMSYYDAMRTVRQAGDNVRLLVGRCGPEVAMKITSSSC